MITGLLAGLLVLGGMAQAQAIFSGDVFPAIDAGTGQPVGGASGTFHVVVTAIGGAEFRVVVTPNPDGNRQNADIGQPSPAGQPVPKAGLGQLMFTFKAADLTVLNVTGISGSTTEYEGPGSGVGVMNNVGGPMNLEYGNTGGDWIVASDSGTLTFSTTNMDLFVAPHGDVNSLRPFGNVFTGTFTLRDPPAEVMVSTFTGSGQVWTANLTTLVPEPASLAMLLPGLLPLGLMLRRKRR